MPWFVIAYILLLVGLGVYDFVDDRTEKRSVAHLTIDAGVNVSWIYFVLAYYYPWTTEPVGRFLPFLLVVSLAWTAADAWREVKQLIAQRPANFDPELSPRANLWIDRSVEIFALLMGFLVQLPSVIFAMRVVRWNW